MHLDRQVYTHAHLHIDTLLALDLVFADGDAVDGFPAGHRDRHHGQTVCSDGGTVHRSHRARVTLREPIAELGVAKMDQGEGEGKE